MGLFNKLFGGSNNGNWPVYDGPELEQFLDGFRVGMPLVGQPEYPPHNTKAYKRGLKIGKREHQKAGSPEIPYESGE